MNSFYSEEELNRIGLKEFGKNVQLSKKTSIYGAENISIGNNVRIDDFCIISGKVKLGNYIHIAAYAALFGGTQGIYLEDFSGISGRTSVYTSSDDYSGEAMTNPTIPAQYRNIIDKPVILEKHSIIGAGCVVLPGVRIREGGSIGALSLVVKDIDEWSINVGIPCKKIKSRSRNALQLENQLLERVMRSEHE